MIDDAPAQADIARPSLPPVEDAQADRDRLQAKLAALRTEATALRAEQTELAAGLAELEFEATDNPRGKAELGKRRERLSSIAERLGEIEAALKVGGGRLKAAENTLSRIARLAKID